MHPLRTVEYEFFEMPHHLYKKGRAGDLGIRITQFQYMFVLSLRAVLISIANPVHPRTARCSSMLSAWIAWMWWLLCGLSNLFMMPFKWAFDACMYPWRVVGSQLHAALKAFLDVSMRETAGRVMLSPLSLCCWCWMQAAEANGLPSSPLQALNNLSSTVYHHLAGNNGVVEIVLRLFMVPFSFACWCWSPEAETSQVPTAQRRQPHKLAANTASVTPVQLGRSRSSGIVSPDLNASAKTKVLTPKGAKASPSQPAVASSPSRGVRDQHTSFDDQLLACTTSVDSFTLLPTHNSVNSDVACNDDADHLLDVSKCLPHCVSISPTRQAPHAPKCRCSPSCTVLVGSGAKALQMAPTCQLNGHLSCKPAPKAVQLIACAADKLACASPRATFLLEVGACGTLLTRDTKIVDWVPSVIGPSVWGDVVEYAVSCIKGLDGSAYSVVGLVAHHWATPCAEKSMVVSSCADVCAAFERAASCL